LELKFSVIIPTYNRSATLGRAIQSVISQTFPAWEVIVVDDGSSDNSRELVKNFPQVRYHYQVNAGVCSARNRGAEIATGHWLIFLDSDDELINTSIEEFTKVVDLNPDVSLFLSGYQRVEKRGLTFIDSPAKSHGYTPALSGTFTISRRDFLKVGKYDEALAYSENMELFLWFSQYGILPKIVESMSLRYYQSSDGGSKNLKKKDESISLILQKHAEKLTKNDLWNLNQTLGVIQLRRRKYAEARSTFWKAISYYPTKFSTYLRLMIAYLPFISKKIYNSDSFTE
jgi:glycosyltransferase involved in cell wall biosynthesis